MSAEDILKSSEVAALEHNQIISHVSGQKSNLKSRKKLKGFGASLFLVAIIGIFALFFGTGNLIPNAISERLIEETDIQYADAIESKKLVFAQALAAGKIPTDTAQILAQNGVTVNDTTLEIDGQIITATDFPQAVSANVKLYNAFTKATYDRAAYYYDDAATKVFQEIGTNRNSYTETSNFDDVMSQKIGNGSNVNINSVSLVKKTRTNPKTGQIETYYEYVKNGSDASSKSSGATTLISQVASKNPAESSTKATLITADTLKVADTVSKEQRSSLFFLTFMENISKMKAGDGNSSKINEAMNYLYQDTTSEVVDVNTGKIITITGTPLESPSLYAILSGTKVDTTATANYSSDRILTTTKNQLNLALADTTTTNNLTSEVINGAIASATSNIKTSIGRFITSIFATANSSALEPITHTVQSSLINNSYDTITGINAGEFLAEGAVNVGKKLAIRGSGATAGDIKSVIAYQKANQSALALDAAADRLNHSPFDITNKNTFLGSIIYKFATTQKTTSLATSLTTFSKITTSSLISLLPAVKAADEVNTYLTTTGNCPTLGNIGAVGSVHCSTIATFDTTTLNDTFNNQGFVDFVNQNTTLNSDGTRTINPGSMLANFILYNNERTTPLGIVDGSILESLKNSATTKFFLSDILTMIKTWLSSSDTNKAIASGAVFVNSESNPDWQTYKYAQRYVSLARATAALNQYTDDQTAYTNIKFFEGPQNPVVAFLDNYRSLANY